MSAFLFAEAFAFAVDGSLKSGILLRQRGLDWEHIDIFTS